MSDLVGRSRALWTRLAGAPVEFRPGGVGVAVSEHSLLCPPGWIGLVVLGGAGIATVPDAGLVGVVAGLPAHPVFLRTLATPQPLAQPGTTPMAGVTVDRAPSQLEESGRTVHGSQRTVPGSAVTAFPAVDAVLGPAALAYLDAADFRPQPSLPPGVTVGRLPAGHPDLVALNAAATPDEVGEAGLAGIESDVFAVRDGSRIVAAAGYERWLGLVAHLCVLTAADARGRGFARVAASAAVVEASREGLLPQWRAVPEASRRVARALGFRELGLQLSVHPLR